MNKKTIGILVVLTGVAVAGYVFFIKKGVPLINGKQKGFINK